MKVGLFIDLKNLYYNVNKRYAGKKVDYDYLRRCTLNFGNLYVITRSIAFGTEIRNEAGTFKNYLEAIGYETQYRRAKYLDSFGLHQRASWDSGITLSIMSLAPRLDVVVLASNNEDFIPVLNWCCYQGLKTHVLACGITRNLMDVCHSYQELTGDHLIEEEKFNSGSDTDMETDQELN